MATVEYDGREIDTLELLPPILHKIYDFKALCSNYQTEIGTLYTNISGIINNQFVDTSSEQGIAKHEGFLNITPNSTDTIDERKFRILAKMNDLPPYTETYLRNKLTDLCSDGEFELEVDPTTYTVIVSLTLHSAANTQTVANLLREIIPANMALIVDNFMVRHEELLGNTHLALAPYTHNQIKYRYTVDI